MANQMIGLDVGKDETCSAYLQTKKAKYEFRRVENKEGYLFIKIPCLTVPVAEMFIDKIEEAIK